MMLVLVRLTPPAAVVLPLVAPSLKSCGLTSMTPWLLLAWLLFKMQHVVLKKPLLLLRCLRQCLTLPLWLKK